MKNSLETLLREGLKCERLGEERDELWWAWFGFWRYLTRGLIWHISQSSFWKTFKTFNMFRYVKMFHVFDNVMYLFDCQNLCITMCCMFFYIFHSFWCYNMNLYFGPAALHYIINNILSILSYLILFKKPYNNTWTVW